MGRQQQRWRLDKEATSISRRVRLDVGWVSGVWMPVYFCLSDSGSSVRLRSSLGEELKWGLAF